MARLRTAGWVVLTVAALIGLEFGLQAMVPDSSIRQLLMLGAIYIMVAVSLNVINGMAGQFSIGHAGFVGIGAYTSAIVASHLHGASSIVAGPGTEQFVHSRRLDPLHV